MSTLGLLASKTVMNNSSFALGTAQVDHLLVRLCLALLCRTAFLLARTVTAAAVFLASACSSNFCCSPF